MSMDYCKSVTQHSPGAGICCEEHWGQLLEGQNFMCLTLGHAQLNSVAELLRLPSLFLYDWALPPWSAPTYPAMAKLVNGGTPSSTPSSSVLDCKSRLAIIRVPSMLQTMSMEAVPLAKVPVCTFRITAWIGLTGNPADLNSRWGAICGLHQGNDATAWHGPVRGSHRAAFQSRHGGSELAEWARCHPLTVPACHSVRVPKCATCLCEGGPPWLGQHSGSFKMVCLDPRIQQNLFRE